ncbi:TPA: hypothetical protein EYN65_14365 [Candidatus Poribacteria bacterium]|nr:hypothetical protein [Candidatus Poribacteria bacterium]HIB90651.1 hypothetical protein [Candidatus Poribacteria bacterium]HIB99611.1 hypothetical protein [Candidatus Poribacteria bacterium]HIN29368.1 hypothetical protein [Candidatus Poribacteria bacterium]HIO07469.1 hypothetical protein [Candidatus Poribacteria bacterium]
MTIEKGTCVYVPQRDGKTKIHHLLQMLKNVVWAKTFPFSTVLVDSWYASRQVMRCIEPLDKNFFG